VDQLEEIRGLVITLVPSEIIIRKQLKPSAIDSVINTTYKEIAAWCKMIDEDLTISGGSVASQAEYTLPPVIFKVERVWYAKRKLTLEHHRPDQNSDKTGKPDKYRVRGLFTGNGKLILDPIPSSSSDEIRYEALTFPDDLSTDTAASEFLPLYNMAVALGTCNYLTLGHNENSHFRSEFFRLKEELHAITTAQVTEKYSIPLKDGYDNHEVTEVYRF
jgi:hypothetical protein